MDDKTLEYMKERVEKAEKIKTKIATIQKFLNELDGAETMDIEVNFGAHRLGYNEATQREIYGIFAALVRASLYKLIQEYQKDLDEI